MISIADLLYQIVIFIAFSLSSVQASCWKEGQHSRCVNHPFSFLSFTPKIRPWTAHWYETQCCTPHHPPPYCEFVTDFIASNKTNMCIVLICVTLSLT